VKPDLEPPRVNLVALHSFAVAAREPSLRAAAEKLHVSVPALSGRLRQLSKDLGEVSLMESDRTGTKLTAVGREVLAYAERLLKSARRLEEFAAGVVVGAEGSVSIACYPVHVERILGEAIARFRKSYPEIRLDFSQMRDDRRRTWGRTLFEELRDGDVDLAVGPPHVGDEYGLDGFRLYLAKIVALVPDGHPFRNSPEIPIAELRHSNLLIAPEGYFSRERVQEAARDAAVSLTVKVDSANPPALLALGRAGLGVPVLPDDYPLVGQQRFPYPAVTSPVAGPIRTEVWIHWRRDALQPPAMERFLASVRDVVSEEEREGRRYQEYYQAEMRGIAQRTNTNPDPDPGAKSEDRPRE